MKRVSEEGSLYFAHPPIRSIEVWTDGSSEPNPGPCSWGAVVVANGREIARGCGFLGLGTNNIAELSAVLYGLSLVPYYWRHHEVAVCSDSRYAVNVLSGVWKAKKNLELVCLCDGMMRKFDKLKVGWVKGHSGLRWNDLADQLAEEASG